MPKFYDYKYHSTKELGFVELKSPKITQGVSEININWGEWERHPKHPHWHDRRIRTGVVILPVGGYCVETNSNTFAVEYYFGEVVLYEYGFLKKVEGPLTITTLFTRTKKEWKSNVFITQGRLKLSATYEEDIEKLAASFGIIMNQKYSFREKPNVLTPMDF